MNQQSSTDSSISPPSQASDAISRRAYEIWEREGRPEGCDFRHWIQAEQELSSGTSSPTGGSGASEASASRTPSASSSSNGNVDTRSSQGTRAAAPAGRDNKRSSGAPFTTEKNGTSSASGQSAGRRKPSSAPAL